MEVATSRSASRPISISCASLTSMTWRRPVAGLVAQAASSDRQTATAMRRGTRVMGASSPVPATTRPASRGAGGYRVTPYPASPSLPRVVGDGLPLPHAARRGREGRADAQRGDEGAPEVRDRRIAIRAALGQAAAEDGVQPPDLLRVAL